jgi:hypothetical protein
MDDKKICLFIAPIGDVDSDTRRRSDQILRYVVQPAARACGYNAIRADQISEPGLITTQVIQHIVDDPIVIADLTERNPNVFYELAIRHVLRKPYVQLIQRGERIPFDVAAIRSVEVDHRDLDSVEAARGEIERQMKSLQQPGAEVDSPISVALDLEFLRRSGNPEQRQLADVLAAVGELRISVASVEKRIGDGGGGVPLNVLREVLSGELRPLLAEVSEATRRPRITTGLAEEVVAYQEKLVSLLGDMDGDTLGPERLDLARALVQRGNRLVQAVAMEAGMTRSLQDSIDRHIRRPKDRA